MRPAKIFVNRAVRLLGCASGSSDSTIASSAVFWSGDPSSTEIGPEGAVDSLVTACSEVFWMVMIVKVFVEWFVGL